MALGPIVLFDQFPSLLAQSAYPDWDSPTPGAFMFALVASGYSPLPFHSVYGNAAAFGISSGNGAPINVAGRQLGLAAGSNSKVTYKFSSANFGVVPQAVKYLLCVIPTVAGTIDNQAKLCWYVDLNTAGSSAELPANSTINLIANGDILGTLG